MSWTRVSLGVAGAAAIFSALLAASTIWLLMTDPAALAAALDHETATPVVRALAAALIDLLRPLLRYL